MKKGLQDPKLAGGYTVPVQARTQPRLHRIGCPRQINERIQRPPGLAIAFKMCRHYGLTINSLTSNDWMRASPHSIHTKSALKGDQCTTLIATTGVIVIAVLCPPGITRVPTITPTVDF